MISLDDSSERWMARAVEEMERRQTVAHVERFIALERRRLIGVPTAPAPPLRANTPRAGEGGYEPHAEAPCPQGRVCWVAVGVWAFAVTFLVLVALALYWATGRVIDGSGLWR